MRPRYSILSVCLLLVFSLCLPHTAISAQDEGATLYVLNLFSDTTPKLTVGEVAVTLPEPGTLSEAITLAAGTAFSAALEYQGGSSAIMGNTVTASGVYLYVVYGLNQQVKTELIDVTEMAGVGYAALSGQARLLVVQHWSSAENTAPNVAITLKAGDFSVSDVAGSGGGYTSSILSSAGFGPPSNLGFIVAPGTYQLVGTASGDAAQSFFTVDALELAAGSVAVLAVTGTQPDPLSLTTISLPLD